MVLNNLASAYEKRGDFGRALENYDQAVHLQPGYAEAYFNRAAVHLANGDTERALCDCGQAIRLKPRFAEALGNRGAVLLRRGQPDKAIADFTAAIEARPMQATLWANRANAYLTLARYGDALTDFDRAIEIDANDVGLYLGRGRGRLFADNTAGAVDDFQKAVQLQPSNPYATIWLHVARVHRGEVDRQEFAKNAKWIARHVWPGALLDYYLGTSSSDDVRKSAASATPQRRERFVWEANFFIGEPRIHDVAAASDARKLLERVTSECKAHDVIYGAALAELRLAAK